MKDAALPEGWHEYDPNNHELADTAEYSGARQRTARAAALRRARFGPALAERSPSRRSVSPRRWASAKGQVSRIEYQADVLGSTLATFVEAMGGELFVTARFPGHDRIELALTDVLVAASSVDADTHDASKLGN